MVYSTLSGKAIHTKILGCNFEISVLHPTLTTLTHFFKPSPSSSSWAIHAWQSYIQGTNNVLVKENLRLGFISMEFQSNGVTLPLQETARKLYGKKLPVVGKDLKSRFSGLPVNWHRFKCHQKFWEHLAHRFLFKSTQSTFSTSPKLISLPLPQRLAESTCAAKVLPLLVCPVWMLREDGKLLFLGHWPKHIHRQQHLRMFNKATVRKHA